MPKGVEQTRWAEKLRKLVGVKEPLMPKGVEHMKLWL